MGNGKMRLRLAVAFASALLAAGFCRTSLAADQPSPAASPAPGLVVSDKAPLGCCCLVPAGDAKPGCSYGLSEDKCHVAGKVLPNWSATWTPGKCPAP